MRGSPWILYCPFPIYLDISKSDNIVETDPFMYKGRCTKAQMNVVTVLISGVESTDDEYLGDHNNIQPCVNCVSNRQKNVPSTSNNGNLGNLRDRVVSLEKSMVEVVADIQEQKLKRIEKNKKTAREIDEDLAAVDEDFATIDEYLIDEVNEVAVGVVDRVASDLVDEVAINAVDKVTGDVVDKVAVDLVDEVTYVFVDEVAGEVIDER
ncbi:hypothetical protein H5410_050741 [Solanum commersonii]|uniref:Uncharacterized protein n=1 Tax=Solanum commersonii TaxID=4109 RepID=A0A9J5WWE7_SOLCO|nr:hypothetical protein H5410_050741 [Solanum commersonii]